MNDYERLAQDVQDAINAAETAYYNAQDEEDQATLQKAIEKLQEVKEQAAAKA